EGIGARLEPSFANPPESREDFPVKASVIIPVRNRVKTIADAARSALSQKTDFPFNVIVVDNHSTDGTTDLLRDLAADDGRLIHIAPARTDYGIGGGWDKTSSSPPLRWCAPPPRSDSHLSYARTQPRPV